MSKWEFQGEERGKKNQGQLGQKNLLLDQTSK